MFHAVVEHQSLVPLRKRALKSSGSFYILLETQLNEGADPVEIEMIIADLSVSGTLILHGIKKSVAMHVDIRLLPEKTLSISSESIHHTCVLKIIHS